MLQELEDDNWAEAFADSNSGNVDKEVESCDTAPATEFGREDVKEILALYEHEGDYAEWDGAGVFLLNDGRYAYVSGGCDTTGWD